MNIDQFLHLSVVFNIEGEKEVDKELYKYQQLLKRESVVSIW